MLKTGMSSYRPRIDPHGDGTPDSHLASQVLVGDSMVQCPKVLGPQASLIELKAFFENDHVHMALVVGGDNRLATTIERSDLTCDILEFTGLSAVGTLEGRTVVASRPLAATKERMLRENRRRLAVVDESGKLLGLLCLKRDGTGFCSDAGVFRRAQERRGIAGLLLTGGRSRRFGYDKASSSVEGVRCAERVAQALLKVVSPVIEIGRGVTELPSVLEEPVGSGPLVAVSAGVAELAASGHSGPVLVLACDLPLVTLPALWMLAGWPGDCSVVPVVDGHPQLLCARWSAAALRAACELVEAGERSMRALLARPDVVLVDEAEWPSNVRAEAFADFDTPDDLRRLGLRWEPSPKSAPGLARRLSGRTSTG